MDVNLEKIKIQDEYMKMELYTKSGTTASCDYNLLE